MARFVAKYAKYGHGIRTGRFMVLADGQRQELTKELFVRFRNQGVSPSEQELGIRTFIHTGLPEDRDTNEHFSPRSRISVFDSEDAQQALGWTDEERELVEFTLRNSPHYGNEFIEVGAVAPEKPWPTYESTPIVKIPVVAQDIGLDLNQVISYERSTANRAEVILLLEDALAHGASDDEVVMVEA